MRTSILEKILKCGIYAVAFVPLVIFSDFISPFHFGKVVVFRSIIEVLAVFYLILIWRDRSYLPSRQAGLPKRDSIFWSLFGFTAIFGLTTIFSVQRYESFWGTLERMGGFWTFLHYFVYFMILTSVFRTKNDWRKLLDVSIFVGFLSVLYGFGQKTDIKFFVGSGNRARIFGTIGNAALFAGYELFTAFLALTLLLKGGNTRNKNIFYGLAFMLSSVSIFMTATRGAILGLGVGLFVFALFYVWAHESRAGKNIILSFVVLGILFLTVSFFFSDSPFIKNSRYLSRIMDTSASSYTAQTRFWAWQAGIEGWKDSFKTILLGWGPENFNIPFSIHFNPKFFAGIGSETFFDRAHNMFVEVLVTMGLVGLLSYLAIFLAIFKSLWLKIKNIPRSESVEYAGLISLLIAYAIHNFFFFDTSANLILFFTFAGFASFLTVSKLNHNQPKLSQKLSGFQVLSMLILLAGSLFIINATNVKATKANYATTRAIVYGWGGDIAGAISKFKESVSYDVMGKYEYRHRFAQYVFENNGKIKDPEVVKSAIIEVTKNADSNPLDYLPQLYISRLNILLGQGNPSSPYNDEALVHSRKALEISPTFVRAYFETGQAYINKRELEKAKEEFQKAVELNPEAGISSWYLALVEADLGNYKEAETLIDQSVKAVNSYSLTESDFARIVNVYNNTGNYPKLAWVFESLIGINPNNAQFHASLASIYAKLNILDKAVIEAKKAAELDSSFDAEARAFIKALGREW